jgi:hypothetical protein
MTLCLKHIDDVSMVTTNVVIVTTNYIGVVTTGHVVDKLDPSLVIDVVPKIVSRAITSQKISLSSRCLTLFSN